MKSLKCRDAGYDCDWRYQSDNEQEIIEKAKEHARAHHGMRDRPELTEKIRSLIRDVKAA